MARQERLAILGASGATGRALTTRAFAEGWVVAALVLPATLTACLPPEGVKSYTIK